MPSPILSLPAIQLGTVLSHVDNSNLTMLAGGLLQAARARRPMLPPAQALVTQCPLLTHAARHLQSVQSLLTPNKVVRQSPPPQFYYWRCGPQT